MLVIAQNHLLSFSDCTGRDPANTDPSFIVIVIDIGDQKLKRPVDPDLRWTNVFYDALKKGVQSLFQTIRAETGHPSQSRSENDAEI